MIQDNGYFEEQSLGALYFVECKESCAFEHLGSAARTIMLEASAGIHPGP